MRWLVSLFLFGISRLAQADTLLTPSYRITIELRCDVANEPCDKVHYTATQLQTGDTVTLIGRGIYRACVPKTAPCLPVGFQFSGGLLTHTVLTSGDLMISEGNKVLVLERGRWQ